MPKRYVRSARSWGSRQSVLAAAVIAAMSSGVHATNYYWDTNGNTAGIGGTANANWSTTNWTTNSNGNVATIAWVDGNDAVFAGSTGTNRTITLGDARTANSLDFSRTTTNDYIVSGTGSLTLTGSATITLGNFGAPTNNITGHINVPITAAGDVTLAKIAGGTDTLNLGGSNSFGGGVRVNGALRVNLNATAALGAATVTVGGDQCTFSNIAAAATSVTVGNNFVLNPLNAANFITSFCSAQSLHTMDFTGQISTSGSATADVVISANSLTTNSNGIGLTIFSGTNTYSGNTIINFEQDGVLRLNSGAALPSTTSLVFGRAGSNLASNNGIVDVYANDISIRSLSTNLFSGRFALGITNSDPGTTTVVRTVNITGNSTTTYAAMIGSMSNANVTGGNLLALHLTSAHSGTLTLTGTSDYSGATTIDGGTLILGHTSDSSNTITSNVIVNSPGKLASAPGTQSTTGRTSGSLTVNSGAAVSPGTDGGIGTLVAGSLNANTGSIFRFDLSSTTQYDVLNLGAGALTLDSGAHTINVFGTAAIGNYSLMTYGSRVWDSTNAFTLGSTPGGSFTYQLTQSDASVILNIFGPPNRVWDIGGGGAPIVEGAGTWQDGSTDFANTATGTAVAATFQNSDNFDVMFGNDAGGSGGQITLGGNVRVGGTLIFGPISSPYQIGAVASSESLTLSANGINAASSASIESPVVLEASQSWNTSGSAVLTVNGAVSGTFALTKIGTGAVTLNASNSYSGGTTISAGTLNLGNNNAAGSGAVALSNNATLNASASIALPNNISVDATGGTISGSLNTTSTFTGTISGTGALTKTGSGTVILTGTNTFSGGLTITGGGILGAQSDAALGTGNMSLGNFSSLMPTASFSTAKNIATLGGGGTTARFNVPTAVTLTLTGNLTGSAALAKEGTGTLVISASNSGFSGNVQWPAGSDGTIETTTSNALGTGNQMIISGDGTLRTDSDLNWNVIRGGAFTLTKEGAGKLTVNGDTNNNTVNTGAAIVVNGGSVQMDSMTGLGGNNTLNTPTTQMPITLNSSTELLINWSAAAGTGRNSRNISLNDGTITRINNATGGLLSEFTAYTSTTDLGGVLTATGNSTIRNQEIATSGGSVRTLQINMPVLVTTGATLTLSAKNNAGDYQNGVTSLRGVNNTTTFPNDAITLQAGATLRTNAAVDNDGEKWLGAPNTNANQGNGKPIVGLGTTGSESVVKLDSHTRMTDAQSASGTITRLVVAGTGSAGLRIEAPMNATYTVPNPGGAPSLRPYDGTTGLFGINTTDTKDTSALPSGYAVVANAYTVMSPKRFNQLSDSFGSPAVTLGGTLTIAATDAAGATGLIDNGPSAAVAITVAVDNTATSGSLVYQIDPAANSGKFANFAGLSVKRTNTGAGSVTAQLLNYASLKALSIDPTANLDVADKGVALDYVGSGPGDNSPSATIRQYLINGRGGVGIGNASWAGTGGITSSAIVTAGDTDGLAVGYREAQPPDFDIDPVSSFGGQTVDDTAVLIRYTYSGDANLDGVVDRSDLLILQNSFNQTSGVDWLHGDFDYNGTCDRDDYNLLSNNFGNAPIPSSGGLTASFGSDFAASLPGSPAAAVPEPTGLGLLGLGAIGLLARRRRSRAGGSR